MKRRNCLLFASLVLLFVSGSLFAQNSKSTLTVAGLSGTVTIHRDGRGVPYINASNDADLYFAQGYVTASDRLWQMDVLRRMSRGRLAEIFGARVVEEDKRWRRMGFAGIADASMGTLNPSLKKALEDYSRGVNAYIATLGPKTKPTEFQILQYDPEPWQPTDTICVGKILAESLSSTWRNDLRRVAIQSLSPDRAADLTNIVTPFDVILFGRDTAAAKSASVLSNVAVSDEAFAAADRDEKIRETSLSRVGLYAEELAASNNWVISGKRTADGRAMLANDPHLVPSAPGIWYLSHLSAPGTRVAGVTFPGVPGIVLGHNEHIAWGATNVGPDVQDLYAETFDDKGRYKTPEGWANVVVRRETLRVRKSLVSPETEEQSFDVMETRNGPIITDEIGQKFALKWTARDPKNQEFEAFFLLNRAKNWEDFRKALETYGGASQNFVFADVKGNIGWQIGGRIPIRRKGDGGVPYNGSTTDGDWTGMIPFDELPRLYNPPSGYIVTANQRTVGTDYKYFSVMSRDAANPWRAMRINDLLKDAQKVTMDKVRDVQHDSYSYVHHELAKILSNSNSVSAATKAALENWDGVMTADSKAGLIVNEIRNCVAEKIAGHHKAPLVAVRERLLFWVLRDRPKRWLPASIADYDELLGKCDLQSRASISDPKRFGVDEAKWRWGSAFVANFEHPLAQAPLIGSRFAVRYTNVSGSGLTPNVGSHVSMRLIASPGNWDATRHVIPLGQSGDPESPHWKDQFETWRTGTPAILPFSDGAIRNSAVTTVEMKGK